MHLLHLFSRFSFLSASVVLPLEPALVPPGKNSPPTAGRALLSLIFATRGEPVFAGLHRFDEGLADRFTPIAVRNICAENAQPAFALAAALATNFRHRTTRRRRVVMLLAGPMAEGAVSLGQIRDAAAYAFVDVVVVTLGEVASDELAALEPFEAWACATAPELNAAVSGALRWAPELGTTVIVEASRRMGEKIGGRTKAAIIASALVQFAKSVGCSQPIEK